MSNTNYHLAILHLLPGAQFTIKDNDYSKIEWVDNRKQPTKDECDAVAGEADATMQECIRDHEARQNIKAKYFKAVRLLVKFAGGMANAPDELKTMKAQIETLESDLQGDD